MHSSTKVIPFYAYTGYHSRWYIFEILELPTNPCVEDRLKKLHKIQVDLSTHLQQAQQTHKVYANRHRLPSSFNIGDWVWLLRQHIKPTQEVGLSATGPSCIIEKINDVAFRLDLPPQLRIHPVFS